MPRDAEKYIRKTTVKRTVSPLWRGIGCILMFLLPVATFGLAYFFTPIVAATDLMPWQILGYIKFPNWTYRVPVLTTVTSFIGGIDNLWLGIILFIVFLVLILGIFSLGYTLVMQVVGPPRYTEKDAPPTGYKPKKYTR